jgi:hypothetical protein
MRRGKSSSYVSSWVFSTSLPAASQKNHNVFNPAKSTTWKAMSGASWSIQYADGSGSSGTVGTDTVTIGGTTVKGQAVEIANKASSQFVTGANDGLVGLSFGSINTGMFSLSMVCAGPQECSLTICFHSPANPAEDLLR